MNIFGKIVLTNIIDWYDGVVLGVATSTWRDGAFIVSLLAFSPQERLRALALLPLDEAQREKLGSIHDWDVAKSGMRDICASFAGSVEIVIARGAADDVSIERRVSIEEVRGDLIGGIEEAVSGARRERWLSGVEGGSKV